MNTITSNTQSVLIYNKSAQEILDLMERLGFTIDVPVDQNSLINEISNIILKNVEGNTNHNYDA